MTDRLISADKIADYVCDKCGAVNCDRNPTYCVERDFIVACAKEMPEAVVRCKDCKWWKEETEYDWDGETELKQQLCTEHEAYFEPNDYCSWGEKKCGLP